MALSVNTPRNYYLGDFTDLPASNVHIYEGAAIGLTSGYVRGLVAGDMFCGFADRECDNSAGSAGGKNVKVRRSGYIELAITGASAVTDAGSPVYASADGTFTLTAGSNSYIGTIERWISGTVCIVRFAGIGSATFANVICANLTTTGNTSIGNAVSDTIGFYNTTPTAQQTHIANAAAATAAALTDNTGGSADNTIANIAPAAAITDNSGGVNPGDNIIAAITNLDTLTDSSGGSVDNTVSAVSAIGDVVVMKTQVGNNGAGALALTGTAVSDRVLSVQNLTDLTDDSDHFETTITVDNQIQQSSADNLSAKKMLFTIARPRQATVNNNFKEVTDQVITQKAANTAILAAVAQLAAKMNTTSTAIGVTEDDICDLTDEVNKLTTDVGLIRTAVNAVLVRLETIGIVAAS